MACKTFQFTSAVRGFHFYKQFWNPEPEQNLNCFHEFNNPFDYFAIKICPISKGEIVGHLPMEISLVTKFIIDRRAKSISKINKHKLQEITTGTGWVGDTMLGYCDNVWYDYQLVDYGEV